MQWSANDLDLSSKDGYSIKDDSQVDVESLSIDSIPTTRIAGSLTRQHPTDYLKESKGYRLLYYFSFITLYNTHQLLSLSRTPSNGFSYTSLLRCAHLASYREDHNLFQNDDVEYKNHQLT